MDEKDQYIQSLISAGASDDEVIALVAEKFHKPSKVEDAFRVAQMGKAGAMIDKRLKPELDKFVDEEKKSYDSIAQAELGMWAKQNQTKYKGLPPDVAKAKFDKDAQSKVAEYTRKFNEEMRPRYYDKLLELEKASKLLSSPGGAQSTWGKTEGGLASFGKQVKNVFANMFPQWMATSEAMDTPRTLDEAIEKEALERKGAPSPKGIPTNFSDIDQAISQYTSKISEEAVDGTPVELDVPAALQDIKQRFGTSTDKLSSEARKEYFDKVYYQKFANAKISSAINEAKRQQKESESLLENVPTTWEDAQASDNLTGYISGAVGQGLGTSAVALGTLGIGAIGMEASGAFMEGAAAKAAMLTEKYGTKITPEDLSAMGELEDVKQLAKNVGLINGALEFVGARLGLGKLAKAMLGKKIIGGLTKAGVTGFAGEGATEFTQELNTMVATKMAGGMKMDDAIASINDKDISRLVEAARQGGIAGGVFGGAGGAVSTVSSKIAGLVPTTGDPAIDALQDQALDIKAPTGDLGVQATEPGQPVQDVVQPVAEPSAQPTEQPVEAVPPTPQPAYPFPTEPTNKATEPGATKATIGNTEVYFTETPGVISLERIETPDEGRGKKSASTALDALLAHADKVNKPVVLVAQPLPGSSMTQKQLQDWYGRHGFEGDVLMRREPKVSKEKQLTKRKEDEKSIRAVETADETEFTDKARAVIAQGVAEGTITPEKERELQGLLNNASGKNATPSSRRKFFTGLRDSMGVPFEVVTDNIKLFVESIKDQLRGMKAADKNARKVRQEEMKKPLKKMMKDLNIPSSKAKVIFNRILGVNPNNDNQVSKLMDYLADLAIRIEADNQFKEARGLQQELRDKLDAIPAQFRDAMAKIGKLDLREVNIDEFIENASKAVASTKPVMGNKYAMADFSGPVTYAEKEMAAASVRLRAELEDMGIDTSGLTDPQVISLYEHIEESDPFAANAEATLEGIKRDKLMEAYEYSRLGLEESDEASSEEGELLLSIDPEFVKAKDVLELIKVMDNAAINGDYSGAGKFFAKAKAQAGMAAALKVKRGGGKLHKDDPSTLNVLPTSETTSLGEAMRFVMGTLKNFSIVKALSGMTGRQTEESNVRREVAEEARKATDIKNAAEKHTKFKDGVSRTGWIALLLGFDPNADPQVVFEKMKNNILTSIDREKSGPAHKDSGERNERITKDLLEFNDREQFVEYVKNKYPWEYKLWKHFNNLFKANAPAFEKATRINFNKPIKLQRDYTPHVQRSLGVSLVNEVGPSTWGKSNRPSSPKASGATIDRTYTLGEGMIYSTNFIIDMLDAYGEQLSQIKVVPHQMQAVEFLKDPRTEELFGGKESAAVIRGAYNAEDNSFRGTDNDPNFQVSKAILGEIVRTMRASVFAGPSRFVLQYIPSLVNLATNIGKNPKNLSLLFTHIPKDFKLMKESTVGSRATTSGGLNLGDAEYNYKTAGLSIDASALEKLLAKWETGREMAAFGQIKGDVNIAERAFGVYYLESLKEQGVDVSKIDLSKEHLYYKDDPRRMQAFNYAQDAVNTRAGASMPELGPAILRTKTASAILLKNLLFALTGFSVQQKKRMSNDVYLIAYGDKASKREAMRDLTAAIAENTTFHYLKIYIVGRLLSEGAYALMDSMGLEYPERDEDKEKKRRAVGFSSAVTMDAMPGLLTVPDAARKQMLNLYNGLAFSAAQEEDPDLTLKDWKAEGNEVFVGGDSFLDNIGLIGALAKGVGEVKYITEDGELAVEKPDGSVTMIPLSEDQEKAIMWASVVEALGLTGLSPQEFTRVAKQIKRETTKQVKEDNK